MKSSSCSRSSFDLGLSSKSTTGTSLGFAIGTRRLPTVASVRAGTSPRPCGELQRPAPRGAAPAGVPRSVRAMEPETVSGIAQDRVGRWLAEHVAGLAPPFRYALIAGGRSNLTYDVLDADGRHVVLRRPPLGNVLQSAHDMGREHRIIAALAPTPVPVPTPLGFCGDPDVTGAPFYVMERVDGVILREADDVTEDFGEDARAQVACSIVDVLADLA